MQRQALAATAYDNAVGGKGVHIFHGGGKWLKEGRK